LLAELVTQNRPKGRLLLTSSSGGTHFDNLTGEKNTAMRSSIYELLIG